MEYKILVVDDEIDNLQLLNRALRRKFSVVTASSPNEAFEHLKTNDFQIIISDNMMPEMEGVEFLKKSQDIAPNAIRILITAYTKESSIISAINDSKIFRYIKKPWNPEELQNVVDSALLTFQLNMDNNNLTDNLKHLFEGTINAITEALDAKDINTSGRSKRVCMYASEIAKKMDLSESDITKIAMAGLLHDIGMIGVPESILNKPDKLTPEEYSVVKEHVRLGMKIIADIKQLSSVIEIIENHHEYYDGNGYPSGKKRDEIPLLSRIIAVADAYDGMVSNRPYREGMEQEKAVQIIRDLSGTQFDPVVVKCFDEIYREFE